MDRSTTSRLGGILIEKGMITRAQLEIAIQEQARRRTQIDPADKQALQATVLGEVLIDLGFITRLQLKRSLNWQMLLRKMTIAMSLVAPLMTLGSPTAFAAKSVKSSSSTSSVSSSSSSVASSSTATAASLPLTIQAENYTDMYGIQTETTTDTGGGLSVGYIDTGDWISYAGTQFVAPQTGVYKVTIRAASLSGGGSFSLLEGDRSIDYGKVTIPSTGGWQNWTDVVVNINMTAGVHSLNLDSVIGGFNLNWIKVEYVGPTSSSSSSSSSTSSTAATSMSATIQAENYTSMYGVQTETTTDTGGGLNVGYLDSGDWLSYSGVPVNAPATGIYKFTFRVASQSGGGSFTIQEADGSVTYASVTVPSTGGWQTWQDVTVTAKMTAGSHGLKLNVTGSGFNLNWLKVDYIGPDTTSSSSSSSSSAASSSAAAAAALPLTVQAENYTSMYGVQTETTTDTGGGLNVGYIDAGDWMSYSGAPFTAPTAGLYKFTFRAASLSGGGSFNVLESDGSATYATVKVPSTGGWQSWVDVSVTASLSAGTHSLKLNTVNAGYNLNWFRVDYLGAALPVKIQAESYDSMSGVQTETTTDTGGGLNVGYIDAGDWMSYKTQPVGIPTTGSYKVSYRVASQDGGSQLTLINPDTGAVLDTITVPKTGGWQTWVTVEKTVSLAAGSQIFGLKALGSGINVNWIAVEALTTTSTGGTSSSTSSTTSSSASSTPTTTSSSSSSAPSTTTSSSNSSATSSTASSTSSTASSPTSSSSSSAPAVSSSSSSSQASSTSSSVSGVVGLKWNIPSQRENGAYLDITEIGGYEMRYRKTTDTAYTYITINDAWQNQYTFSYLQGTYIFEIAVFDKNGLYSSFVSLKPL